MNVVLPNPSLPSEHTMLPRTLCVGIGSPHGDDQVGWRIMEQVDRMCIPDVQVRRAASPIDLLDWVQACGRLIVCDACRGAGGVGSVHRWNWPCPSFAELQTATSHAFGLDATLRLAAKLGRLPAEVVVWAVETLPPQPNAPLSEPIARALPDVVRSICRELCHA